MHRGSAPHCALRVEVPWRFWRCFPAPRQPHSAEKSSHCVCRLLWRCLKERDALQSAFKCTWWSSQRSRTNTTGCKTLWKGECVRGCSCMRMCKCACKGTVWVCAGSWLKGFHSLYRYFFPPDTVCHLLYSLFFPSVDLSPVVAWKWLSSSSAKKRTSKFLLLVVLKSPTIRSQDMQKCKKKEKRR